MNLAPLGPMVVGIVTPLVLLLTQRNTHLVMDGCSVYRWSRGVVAFCLIGFYAMGLFMGFQSSLIQLPAGKVIVTVFFLAGTVSCLYLYRFRVVIDATSIQTGAFSLKKMDFREVVRAWYVQGQNSGQIILENSIGKQINIWETVNDFGACAREINSRLPEGVSIASEGRMAGYLDGRS